MDDEGRDAQVWKYSDRLHCADCDIEYTDPLPSSFSFNSPLGACESCRGFGRVIGIDFGLVIPDETKTLLEGAIKPWTTPSYKGMPGRPAEVRAARRRAAGRALEGHEARAQALGAARHADWKGGNDAWKHQWYGVQRFFDWLETKAYKMHVRVLLSSTAATRPAPPAMARA